MLPLTSKLKELVQLILASILCTLHERYSQVALDKI